MRYSVLISRQPGGITVSVAQGGTATSGATKQPLPTDRVLRELFEIELFFHIETVRCGHKVGTQKENTEYGLEVRKIY